MTVPFTRRTLLEASGILLVSLVLALLYHALTPSGITIFKKRPAQGPSSHPPQDGGRHGA